MGVFCTKGAAFGQNTLNITLTINDKYILTLNLIAY